MKPLSRVQRERVWVDICSVSFQLKERTNGLGFGLAIYLIILCAIYSLRPISSYQLLIHYCYVLVSLKLYCSIHSSIKIKVVLFNVLGQSEDCIIIRLTCMFIIILDIGCDHLPIKHLLSLPNEYVFLVKLHNKARPKDAIESLYSYGIVSSPLTMTLHSITN